MAQLDDIDQQILELLQADARRSLRDIGEEVDRSAPTVSDRIEHLQEIGVIRRFTVDIDRSILLSTGQSLLIARAKPAVAERLVDDLAERDEVERIFRGMGGTVFATAATNERTLDDLLQQLSEQYPDTEWSVEPLVETKWSPKLGVTGAFELTCAVCGNTVSEKGERIEVEQDNTHVVCCSSCASNIVEQYDELSKELDDGTE